MTLVEIKAPEELIWFRRYPSPLTLREQSLTKYQLLDRQLIANVPKLSYPDIYDDQGYRNFGSVLGVRNGEIGQYTYLELTNTQITFRFWVMSDQQIYVDEFDPQLDKHDLEFSLKLVAAETLLTLAIDPHNTRARQKAQDFGWNLSKINSGF